MNSFHFKLFALLGSLSCAVGAAAVDQYRSVGPGNINALAQGTASNQLTINASGWANFSEAMPDAIGIGDVLQYDSNDDGTVDQVAFIRQRGDSFNYTLSDVAGNLPAVVTASTSVWRIYRAYTSLNNAIYGDENFGIDSLVRNFDVWTTGRDLIANGERWNIACYGDAVDTTPVQIRGTHWKTSVSSPLRIFTPHLPGESGTPQRHQGKWTPDAYSLEVPDNTCIWIDANYVTLEGLQLRVASVNGFAQDCITFNGAIGTSSFLVSDCIFFGTPTSFDTHNGITLYNVGDGKLAIWNNLFYQFKRTGTNWVSAIDLSDAQFLVCCYNNTIVDCYQGISVSNGTVVAKNNLVQMCTTGYIGAFDPASDHNLSNLNDAPGSNPVNNATVVFLNPGGLDYHLASADLYAKDKGVDLTADPNHSFDDDIDHDPRTAPWDIGADEFLVATPTVTPPIPVETATPSVSPTSTSGWTPTVTRTPSPTPSRTVTPLYSPSVTRTVTPTPTFVFSVTPCLTIRAGTVSVGPNVLRPGLAEWAEIGILLESSQTVQVKLFSQSGRLVATLLDEEVPAGPLRVRWTGTDDQGHKVGSGVYILHVKCGSVEERKKIVVVR